MTTQPVERTQTALYRRSGTILAAGACIVLAGLLQVGAGALLVVVGGSLVPDDPDLAGLADVVRAVGVVFAVFGAVALAVGAGVLRVRAWARVVALVYGFATVAWLAVVALTYRDPAVLLQPNLPALVTFLLLRPGVAAAFAEAEAERRARRDARPARPGSTRRTPATR